MPLPERIPDLAALDLFATVAELGSVSRAARLHGVTQPSASSRLTTMERRLGLDLLDRGPTGTTLTPAGRLVAEWVAPLLRAAADLGAGVEALRAGRSGRTRVAASYTVAEHLLPAWLGRFQRLHPDLHVELEVTNSTTVLERVRAGRTELGFIESPDPAEGLAAAEVGCDELVAVVPPGHPWSRRSAPLPPVALSVTPLVLREAGSGTRDALALALRRADLGPPRAALELGSTAAVKSAVAAGGPPAVLSRLAVAADVAAGRLVEVPVAGLDLTRSLRMVWPTHRAPGGPAELLRDHLLG